MPYGFYETMSVGIRYFAIFSFPSSQYVFLFRLACAEDSNSLAMELYSASKTPDSTLGGRMTTLRCQLPSLEKYDSLVKNLTRSLKILKDLQRPDKDL